METSETTTSATTYGSREIIIPDLVGRSGLLGVEVDGRLISTLRLVNGRLEIAPPIRERVETVIICRSADDFAKLWRGELNSVVAAIRGRWAMRGDLALATRVMRGLQAAGHVTGSAKEV